MMIKLILKKLDKLTLLIYLAKIKDMVNKISAVLSLAYQIAKLRQIFGAMHHSHLLPVRTA